jgi:hypothetical protein
MAEHGLTFASLIPSPIEVFSIGLFKPILNFAEKL